MSLDTDLGIDSIKRVEILSALQTRLPEAPVVKPEDLGRLQTLRQIVAFLHDGGAAAPVVREEVSKGEAVPAQGANGHGSFEQVLLRHVLTVVPLDGGADRPKLPLKAGVAIWVTEDGAGLARRVCAALGARGFAASVVGLDVQAKEGVAGLLVLATAHPEAGFIQSAFGLIQRMGPTLRAAGRAGGAVLASASMMDGCFALNGHTPKHPVTGGLAGLVKTARHEWPEVACKSLDLSHDPAEGDELAGHIVEELLVKGPAEVGISARGRCETKLVQKSLNGEVGKNSLGASDVVVVTGGARGVTAAVSLALAKAYRCKLLLIGRSAAPTAEPAWLKGVAEEGAIKKAIAAKLKESGAAANPRAVEEAYRRAMGNREVLATLAQIEASGATVMYRSLDVRDGAAVAAAIDEARQAFGPIRGVIHEAGVLQDRLIEQKTSEQFDAVYSTKVGGFTALLEAVKNDPLKVIVAFSSSTGRFGRKGQVAYAAANEVLNKLAQEQAHQRPGCRVLSMNWGPWEGGMVTPQLARVFENEGIGLIPLEAGAEYLVKEMSTPAGGPVEIVILGPEPEGAKRVAPAGSASTSGMVVALERTVSVETHPFLKSHVLKGKAVLPAAMMVEWLGHGAMHENPGLAFCGFEELRIFKGVTLQGNETVGLTVLAGAAVSKEGMERVPVELRSGNVLHARATILLGAQLPAAPQAGAALAAERAYSVGVEEIYGSGRLFHGPALQGIVGVKGWSEEGIIGEAAAGPAPATWMRQPLRSGWLADPLAMDAAFQLMILWCFEAHGVGSLPTGAASYRQFVRSFPQAGVEIRARVVHASEHSAEAVIEFVDRAGTLVARMDGYECVMDRTLKSAFATNQLA